MPIDPKSSRAQLRLDTLAATLEQKLEKEDAILDALVGAASKGQPQADLWAALHAAAQRDDRLAELAFAYEGVSRDKRLKALTPATQAEVLMHAATFFADVFGDPEGAIGYLERILTISPSNAAAFAKLESVLVERQDVPRLSE